jgi:hypothetical protein
MAKKRAKSRRRKRRGLGDLLDSAITSIQAKQHRRGRPMVQPALAERLAKQRLCRDGHAEFCPAPSAATVAKSEAKAERAGCAAPRGRTCVSKDVALLRPGKYRRGCKRAKAKGTFTCTDAALKMKASGRHVGASSRALPGYRFASWKSAVNAKTGKFNTACRFYRGKPICKTSKKG